MANAPCTVCGEAAKYKCPACEARYCSVGCCRAHRAEGCMPQAQPAPPAPAAQGTANAGGDNDGNEKGDEEEDAKHRLRPEDLQRLDGSARVKELLADPCNRALIEAVRRDPHPLQAIRALRQQAGFEELARALLCAAGSEDTQR
ncbi:Zinc finger HIT domain-containing protein 3 [Coemansia helicoidea]|uniref:Zinc finger HIT domain-containing protein 3 n=1 Tax=Coemansia helicoidea TaxID=1286919 RepID=A0ACC1LD80_9FUNG|nr:Zinc finger HIT domain-containing protein 3 [Coemansia helicoidea]